MNDDVTSYPLDDAGKLVLRLLQGMYLFTAAALMFMGPGRFSVNRR